MTDSDSSGATGIRCLDRGHLLPDLNLVSIDGASFRISDFKGRRNIAIVLAAADDVLLNQIAQQHSEFVNLETQVIAVLSGPREQVISRKEHGRWPFLVVAQPTGTERHLPGADRLDESDPLVLFVTDRWGEIFFKYASGDGQPRPTIADLLDWLSFVEMQCEECFPPVRTHEV